MTATFAVVGLLAGLLIVALAGCGASGRGVRFLAATTLERARVELRRVTE